jgi:ABC-type branched-subunit amino acid transport system permease subunit
MPQSSLQQSGHFQRARQFQTEFLNELPLYQPIMQAKFLVVWLVVTILYFAAGCVMLVANYRRLDDPQARRRVGALYLALVVLAVVVAHNFFVRNWTSWFGSTPPALFSGAGFGRGRPRCWCWKRLTGNL